MRSQQMGEKFNDVVCNDVIDSVIYFTRDMYVK